MTQEEELKCHICGEICKRGVKVKCCSAIGCRACCVKAVTRDKKCWNSSCDAVVTSKDLINDEELRGKVDKYLAQKKADTEKQELAELPVPVPTNQKKTEDAKAALPVPVPTSTKKTDTSPTDVTKKTDTPTQAVAKKTDTPAPVVSKKTDTSAPAVTKKSDTPTPAVIKKVDTPPTETPKKTDTQPSGDVGKTNTPSSTAAETKSNGSLGAKTDFPPPVSANKNSSTKAGENKSNTTPTPSVTPSAVSNKSNTPSKEKETKSENEPPVKKQKVPVIQEKVDPSGKVTVNLDMMKQRNQEFDQNLNEVERASSELRYGALLELMFTFSNVNAKCRMCFDEIKSDFMVLKHIQMKHKDIYQNFKVVLSAPNLNQLNLFLHKSIKAEFLYAQKGEFPIPVDS